MKAQFRQHIKCSSNGQRFTTLSRILLTLYEKYFENIVQKGENAGNKHFLLVQKMVFFYPYKHIFQFWVAFMLSSANPTSLDWFDILLFGKELIFL